MSTPLKTLLRGSDQQTLGKFRTAEYYPEFDILRSRLRAESPLRDDSKIGLQRVKRIDQLEQRLQLILGHNSSLLQEVAALTAALDGKCLQVKSLQNELILANQSQALGHSRLQRQRFAIKEDIDKLAVDHRAEVERLQNQVRHWKREVHELERAKNAEISGLRKKHDNERYQTINLLRRSENQTKDECQVQIIKLRQIISMKDFQLEEANKKHLNDITRLSEEIDYLNDLLKHRQAIKESQLSDLVRKYQNELALKHQEQISKAEVVKAANEREFNRLKHELNTKSVEIANLENRVSNLGEFGDKENRKQSLEKEKLRLELQSFVSQSLEAIEAERTKERQICRAELEGLQKNFRQRESLLLMETQKLKELCQHKVRQIGSFHKQMEGQRQFFIRQSQAYEEAIGELKNRIAQILTLEELEKQALKIKYAEISQADIKTLVAQLQRQGEDLTTQLRTREQQLEDKGARLEQALKEKSAARKNYQLQLAQLRTEKEELMVKLSNLRAEMQEQVSMVQSKLDVQTGSLQRDCQSQRAGLNSSEEQRKKLMEVIQAKDNEIKFLNDKFVKARANYQEERRIFENRLAEKESLFKELDLLKDKEIQSLKLELSKKESVRAEDNTAYENKIGQQKNSIDSSQKRIEDLERQVLLQQRAKEKLAKDLEELQAKAALKEKAQEAVAAESFNAHNEQMFKSKTIVAQKENKLKEYYEGRLAKFERDLADLRGILAVKEEEILQLRERNQTAEARLGQLMESSQKLKGIEQKVLKLGIDKGLLKNMEDLFRTKRS